MTERAFERVNKADCVCERSATACDLSCGRCCSPLLQLSTGLVLGFRSADTAVRISSSDRQRQSGQRQDVRRGQRRRAGRLIRYVQ